MKKQTSDTSQAESTTLDVEVEEAEVYTASQWKLMWWKFRKHRLAKWSGIVIVTLYLVAAFCEFLAPYKLKQRDTSYAYAPPQRIRFVSEDGFHLRPFVYGLKGERHMETLRKYYVEDRARRYPICLFVRDETYRLWGLFRTDVHLFGVENPPSPHTR